MEENKQSKETSGEQTLIQDLLDVIKKHQEEKINSGEFEVDEYDLFEDRLLSLLVRWRTFHNNNKDRINGIGTICLRGVLDEINDDFTQSMLGVRNSE